MKVINIFFFIKFNIKNIYIYLFEFILALTLYNFKELDENLNYKNTFLAKEGKFKDFKLLIG